MGLGAADAFGEARPLGGDPGQAHAGGVDQPHGVFGGAPEAAARQRDHVAEQAAEDLVRPQRIGVGQGRAGNLVRTQMVEPARVTLHRRLDLTQRRRPGELGVEQRHQLALGGKLAHPRISAVLIHKIVERRPGYVLQKPVQDAIVMAHGVASFSCPNHRQVFESE